MYLNSIVVSSINLSVNVMTEKLFLKMSFWTTDCCTKKQNSNVFFKYLTPLLCHTHSTHSALFENFHRFSKSLDDTVLFYLVHSER